MVLLSCLGLLLNLAAWAQSSTTKKTAKRPSSSSKSSKSTSHKSSAPSKGHNPASKTASGKPSKSHSASKKTKGKTTNAGWRTRGQQNIDGSRAREIQSALIQSHYMDGQ